MSMTEQGLGLRAFVAKGLAAQEAVNRVIAKFDQTRLVKAPIFIRKFGNQYIASCRGHEARSGMSAEVAAQKCAMKVHGGFGRVPAHQHFEISGIKLTCVTPLFYQAEWNPKRGET